MIKYRFSIPSDDDRNNVYSVLSGLPVLLISMVSEYVPQSLTNFPEFFTGLKVNDQLVAHATRFFIVRLKNRVLSHVRA